jgi:formate hydrogenlyase subunit 6/NADH:ubiquinone oxidoreductase subunit I
LAILPVVCVKCNQQFLYDTEKNLAEGYRSIDFPQIFIGRCTHCGYTNRIEIRSSEV